MSSWGHRVVWVNSDTVRNLWTSVCGAGRRKPHPGCSRPVEYLCCYTYVTGKAGRVTEARKGRCAKHAQEFAKRHKIPGPGDIE